MEKLMKIIVFTSSHVFHFMIGYYFDNKENYLLRYIIVTGFCELHLDIITIKNSRIIIKMNVCTEVHW